MKKILVISLSVLLGWNTISAQEEKSVRLSELEVQATSVRMYSELGRIVTVIEKSEVSTLPVQSIDQLLDYVVGLDIRQRGTGGVQSDISIRGGSFDQVLVLLNGVNITNPQTGHYNLDIPISLADVERIEVLQGSAARVLGTNAFSGAINIVTEQPERKKISTQITMGSYNTTSQNVSLGYNIKNFGIFTTGSHSQSDGYINNTDYNISNIFLHLTQKTSKIGKFELQGGFQHKAYGANGFYSLDYPNQFDQTGTFFTSLNWSFQYKKWAFNAHTYWRQHHDWFELFRDFEDAPSWYKNHNYHQTDIFGGKTTASYLSSAGKFTLGIDIRNEHIFSNVLGEKMKDTRPVTFNKNSIFTHEANRLLSGAFADYSKKFNRFFLSVGGAISHTEKFGAKYYGGIDLGYEINNYLRIFSTFNTAVRLPTFTDLYYKSATQLSNPDLQPETSKTVELGMKYSKEKWAVDICGFYRMGSNIIDWVRQPDSIRWESKNLTNINAIGGDISFSYKFDSRFFKNTSISYSYLHLDKMAKGFDSKYALDYLKHKLQISLHHNIYKKLSVSWKGSMLDRSGDYSNHKTGEMKEYLPVFLLDGKLMWTERRFSFFAEVNNILNTQYADYGGLPQPGINLNAGVKLSIE